MRRMENAQAIKIVVTVTEQALEIRDPQGVVFLRLPLSTSRYGLGFDEGSYKTPTGLFRIAEKIGEGLAPGAILKGRKWTGEIWTPAESAQFAQEDLILTRVLWLEGLEEQNANTRARYIYFHGTNHEDQIGTAASHGCIRLTNADMLRLYPWVNTGDLVQIV